MANQLTPKPLTLPELFQQTMWQLNVRELQRSFELIFDLLNEQAAGVEATIRTRWGLKPGDPIPDEYDDETGQAASERFAEDIVDTRHGLDTAAAEIRTAALVALFHTFERDMLRMAGAERYFHKPTMEMLRTRGYYPHDQKLLELQLAANAAKHGSGVSARQLRQFRPELFPRGVLAVSLDELTDFFEAVTSSLRAVPVPIQTDATPKP